MHWTRTRKEGDNYEQLWRRKRQELKYEKDKIGGETRNKMLRRQNGGRWDYEVKFIKREMNNLRM